jgi:hypothetical protein
VKERLLGVSAMLTLSVARTRIVYVSSAGKLEAAKVYAQSPAERDVVFQTSLALEKEPALQ